MMHLRVITSVVLLAALFPTSVGAVCVQMPLEYHLSDDSTEAVFRGTIRDVQMVPPGQIVTFEVERVWKGRVSRTVITYNSLSGGYEERKFMRGERYLVMAHRLNAMSRARFGGDMDALGVSYCGSYPAEIGDAKEIVGDAEGWAPQEAP
jgi:hypothetical protein